MAPIRFSVQLPVSVLWKHFKGEAVESGLAEADAAAATMIGDLLWWTEALRAARAQAAS